MTAWRLGVTRARHALAADAGRTRRRAAGALPPPAASADRMLFPLCGAIKQQASNRIGLYVQLRCRAAGLPPPAERATELKREAVNNAPLANRTQILILRAASAMAFLTVVLLVQATRQFASSSGFLFARRPLPLQLGPTAVWQKIFDCQSRMGPSECTMSKGCPII
jgi:hypothetical protein